MRAIGFLALVGFSTAAHAQADYTPDLCNVPADPGRSVPAVEDPGDPGVADPECDPGSGGQAEVLGVQQAANGVSPSGTLPYTGSDSSVPLVQMGVVLLAVGGVLVLVVRRRRGDHAEA